MPGRHCLRIDAVQGATGDLCPEKTTDVYKRQGLTVIYIEFGKTYLAKHRNKDGEKTEPPATGRHTDHVIYEHSGSHSEADKVAQGVELLTAVSYTHLDVYKRQDIRGISRRQFNHREQ